MSIEPEADPVLKNDWERIASGYRELAQTVLVTDLMEEFSKEPSASSASQEPPQE